MNVYIAVAIGGAIGAITRYSIGQFMATKMGIYPWGTVFVNIIGSLLIGIGMAIYHLGLSCYVLQVF